MGRLLILAHGLACQKIGSGWHDPIIVVAQIGMTQGSGRVGPKETAHRASPLDHFNYHFLLFIFYFFLL